jgi:hypothetical protein
MSRLKSLASTETLNSTTEMELLMNDDNEENSTSPEPDSKRRKLRKGTRSCWDCKKRKVKCTFKAETDAVCIACARRGAHCVSQEHPEEEAYTGDGRDKLFERIVRVEALLEDIAKKVGQSVVVDGHPAGFDPYGKPRPMAFSPLDNAQSLESLKLPVSVEKSEFKTSLAV